MTSDQSETKNKILRNDYTIDWEALDKDLEETSKWLKQETIHYQDKATRYFQRQHFSGTKTSAPHKQVLPLQRI